MFDINNIQLFIISVFLLSITPGPDIAYVVGQSVVNGRRAGVISAAGVALGSCAHAFAGVVGLTALIAASPVMFTMIKYLGALYLLYLGGKLIVETFGAKRTIIGGDDSIKKDIDLYGLLSKGFITTLMNPKVLLFFISFFPQFVVPGGHQTASILVLGLTYTLIVFLTETTFAMLAGSATGSVSRNRQIQKLLDRVVGGVFIALGIKLGLVRT
ncbi:lysine exporter protein LysE/YggA [Pseudomonas syringae BRIP39023]|uniref:LysE family translocator n=1 Tax=Pseudomonas syringae TaxID=317 RepID=UPI0002A78905|nr:LysE family translocator [Pseudomonas syringae]ELQ08690.1 lysine exporter protein LysE/YggA [Pseudomonas syringae BRIP39023]MCK9749783.1 LysE family translocator [Pseudomonas syringae pv. syringae]MCK9754052.1 LysE family translocator [Pseudomonas syringae pv. syringae]